MSKKTNKIKEAVKMQVESDGDNIQKELSFKDSKLEVY